MRRKALLFAAFLLSGLATVARSEFAGIPYHELVNSDVVVAGTLEEVTRDVRRTHEYNTGRVRVDRVFAGNTKPGERLEVTWENDTDAACQISHGRLKGRQAVWFLRLSNHQQYDANHIERALPLVRDVLENFLEYFPKRHGPPDTELEGTITSHLRERLGNLP